MARMLILFFLGTISGTGWSQAGEPSDLLIVVPDRGLVEQVSTRFPGARIGVLEQEPGESDEVVKARAWRWRNAKYLVYDASTESTRSALFRERLQSQGVIAFPMPSMQDPRRTRWMLPGRGKNNEIALRSGTALPQRR